MNGIGYRKQNNYVFGHMYNSRQNVRKQFEMTQAFVKEKRDRDSKISKENIICKRGEENRKRGCWI